MKLQNLTIIFIIIILPIILVLSAYIGFEIKTINKQNMYNTGLISATHDAIFSFELNTKNDSYNNNAETKRSNIKAAVKTFENSLSTTCNLGLYNNQEIEEYIPAIVFGLYDGFYMYAPFKNQNGEYKHNLRNYVYYSETINNGNIDIVVRYTLDNYVAISGTINGNYVTKAGYLINFKKCSESSTYYVWKNYNNSSIDWNASITDSFKYNSVSISQRETIESKEYDANKKEIKLVQDNNNQLAKKYYEEAIAFSSWVNYYIGNVATDNNNHQYYLNMNNDKNDPEDENSPFVQHKREIIKKKMEEVLNSSITAYSRKSSNTYKMPKFSEEDWEKIYNNISIISFVQGMNLGFKSYNNYCILNSTNSQEYVNPNLMYFIDNNAIYHDIRCEEAKNKTKLTGYKIGDFEKTKVEVYERKHGRIKCAVSYNDSRTQETVWEDENDGKYYSYSNGNLVKYIKDNYGGFLDHDRNNAQVTINRITTEQYYYKHDELACYNCVNGTVDTDKSVYDYIRDTSTPDAVKKAYFTALARERQNTTKLLSNYNVINY